MLERPDVGLFVLGGELHLFSELAFNVTREQVELFLSTLGHLLTTFVIATDHRQLHSLQRLYTNIIVIIPPSPPVGGI